MKVTIADLECSVCLLPNSLTEAIVSELSSGVGIGNISISDLESRKIHTEDKALDLMTQKLAGFVPLVECFGAVNIKEVANQGLELVEASFGKRPRMETVEGFSLVEAENNQERGEKINDS